jgi:translocation and assembly module TamB
MTIKRTSAFIGLAALLVAGAFLLSSTLSSRSADDDAGILSSFLSRVLSTPASRVSIGSVQGALLSDSTINDISIADRDGVWLKIDRVRFNWTRSALLFRKLQIDKLEIGTVTIARRRLQNEMPDAVSDEPLLPELPLKVEIKDFSLKELALGEPVIGLAARMGAIGAATLGDPAEGLNLIFDARRLDAPGSLTARLELVPTSQRLTLKIGVDEPAGGVAAHALNIPGRPPVKLNIDGGGTLDTFDALVAFTAGPGVGGNGNAQVRRAADTRRLTLAMAAQIEGLLPAVAAPVFAGTTQLNGNVAFADSGAISISPLTIVSQTARLDINGGMSADQIADLAITARALPNAGDKTAASGTEVGSLAFDATVKGPIAGPAIVATLDARDIATPQGKAGTVTARFNATPTGDVTEKTTAVPFTAEAQISGLVARDTAVNSALGNTVSLTAAGTWSDGIADVRNAQVQTSTAQARFTGRIGGKVIDGKLAADVPELARFGALSSLQLRGALALTADLTGVPDNGQINASIDGQAMRFGTGIAAIDGLAGGRLGLKGTVRKLPAGGFGFGDLRLAGEYASARLDGEATVTQSNVDVRATVADLRRADSRLSGRADLTGTLTGTVEKPNGKVTLTVADARALGRPVPRLVLDVTATDLTGLLDARATLNGTVDNKPAQGALRLAKQDNGAWLLNDVDVRVGSVIARGGVTLSGDRLAAGQINIDAGNLDDLSPLVLTKLAGQLRANTTLTVAEGAQNVALTASARGVKVATATIDRLDAQLRATDLYRKPVIDGTVAIDRATVAGEQISQIRLDAKGAAAASDITLTAQARGFALDARGRLVADDNIRLDLSRLTAQRDKRSIALTKPTSLTLRDNGVDINDLTMTLDRGRLSINGRAGDTYDLAVSAKAVPLSIADVFVPKLGLSGTLEAEATITGPADAPTGNWKLSIDDLVAPQTRNAGLPPLDISASGRLADGRTTLDGNIGAKAAGAIRVNGTIPLQGDGLDVTAKGKVNIGLADRFLAQAGRSASGSADIDFRATGSLTRPQVNGAASIGGGAYRDIILGIKYTNINGRLIARGSDITVERLSAQTPNGGTITAQGNIAIDPEAGFPGTIRIASNRGKLIDNEIYSLVANLNLSLSGPLARSPAISGKIDVVSLDVTIPERLAQTLSPIPGTVHVSPPPQAAARLAAQARAKARASRQPAFDAALDLTISAPNRVFVRGRGIDAELGGDLRLRGRLSDPVTDGAFDLRRGRISIAGTRLDFTQGRVLFTGDLTPTLDFVAQTRVSDVTATIAVSGSAREPDFAFSSEPDLPQDEVISRILFSKASGGLSAIQALQLAQVAAQFSGGGGNDVFERVRKSLGVDSLDVSVGTNGNPTVGISRSLNRRLSIGVKTGTEAADSGVTVDFDVTRNIRLKGEADANGGTAVGAGVEWEY